MPPLLSPTSPLPLQSLLDWAPSDVLDTAAGLGTGSLAGSAGFFEGGTSDVSTLSALFIGKCWAVADVVPWFSCCIERLTAPVFRLLLLSL